MYDCKTNIVKSWNTSSTNGKERYPRSGLQPVWLENKDNHVLDYNLYGSKTNVALCWITTCTNGKQR